MCTYVYIRNSHMRGRERGRETTWKKRGEASISYLRGATRSTYTVEPKYGNCRSNLMTMCLKAAQSCTVRYKHHKDIISKRKMVILFPGTGIEARGHRDDGQREGGRL